jgi:hypothetical protein
MCRGREADRLHRLVADAPHGTENRRERDGIARVGHARERLHRSTLFFRETGHKRTQLSFIE